MSRCTRWSRDRLAQPGKLVTHAPGTQPVPMALHDGGDLARFTRRFTQRVARKIHAELQRHNQAALRCNDHADRAINERATGGFGPTFARAGGAPRNGLCAAHLLCHTGRHRKTIDALHDVGVEDGEQRVKVTPA